MEETSVPGPLKYFENFQKLESFSVLVLLLLGCQHHVGIKNVQQRVCGLHL